MGWVRVGLGFECILGGLGLVWCVDFLGFGIKGGVWGRGGERI